MKLTHAQLRGAIGIQRGLGLDEISVDFSAIPPGLVALVAPNGHGKTTLLENLQPFRTLVSREGSLWRHFSLKDSHRILTFEMGGATYTSRMLMNAVKGDGEYYLEKNGESLNPDGKTASYDAAVAALFGSELLFFRSMFKGQNALSFAKLKTAERRDLFAELIGLQHYIDANEWAKGKRDGLDRDLADVRQRIEYLRGKETELLLAQVALKDSTHSLAIAQEGLVAAERTVETTRATHEQSKTEMEALETLENEYVAARDAVRETERAAEKAEEVLRDETKELEQALERIEARHARLVKIRANGEKIEAGLARLNELETRGAELDAKNRTHGELRDKEKDAEAALDRTRQERAKVRLEIEKTLTAEGTELASKITSGEAGLKSHRGKLERAETAAGRLGFTPCCDHAEMVEACEFLKEARKARDEISINKAAVEQAEDDLAELQAALAAFHIRRDETLEEFDEETTGTLAELNATLNGCAEEIAALNFDPALYHEWARESNEEKAKDWPGLKAEYDRAEADISELVQDRDAATKNIKAKKTQLSDLSITNSNELRRQEQALEELSFKVQAANKAKEGIEATLRAATEAVAKRTAQQARVTEFTEAKAKAAAAVEQHEKAIAEAAELEAANAEKIKALEGYSFLARATAKDGLQALEIDAAGPSVSQITNELLGSAFDTDFRIDVVTLRETADGKSTKEVFDFDVHRGDAVQELGTLSGGEGIWIEAGLQMATGKFRDDRVGFNVETAFYDETDGPLDPDNAFRYLKLLRKFHELSGNHHTFLITHRHELLSHIPAKLRLVPGEGVVVAEEEK